MFRGVWTRRSRWQMSKLYQRVSSLLSSSLIFSSARSFSFFWFICMFRLLIFPTRLALLVTFAGNINSRYSWSSPRPELPLQQKVGSSAALPPRMSSSLIFADIKRASTEVSGAVVGWKETERSHYSRSTCYQTEGEDIDLRWISLD